jgi:3-dehydroquinate synthase
MPEIRVKLGERSYPILIGLDMSRKLSQLVKKHVGNGRLFIFFDAQFYALHGHRLRQQLAMPSSRVYEAVVPRGEQIKSAGHLSRIYDFLLGLNISRSDFILACGGGVTTDLIGYAAATVLRGVSWAAVPTTLVGMVDAAIGGKTGVNHTLGKNLIGAIWQPRFVLADVHFLGTLPRRQMIAGVGEIVKYAGLIGEPFIERVTDYLAQGDPYDTNRLVPIVTACARYKAGIVGQDETETGERMFLNYGHTIGHGVERALGFKQLLHGEAVAIGLLAALEIGKRMKPNSDPKLTGYRSLVEQCIKMIPKRSINAAAVMDAISLDKKRRDGRSNFVLLERPGKPFITGQVDKAGIRNAVTEALAVYSGKKGSHGKNSDR